MSNQEAGTLKGPFILDFEQVFHCDLGMLKKYKVAYSLQK